MSTSTALDLSSKNSEKLQQRDGSEARNISPRENRRDISNFLRLRTATPGDDPSIGAFLLHTFLKTYQEKMPLFVTTEERKRDLLNVSAKRKVGTVCVLELGYRIVGTFSLIHPESDACEAWLENSANLRCVAIDPDFQGLGFSEILLTEAHRIARLWEVMHVCLHVQNGADAVARLYQKSGYIRDSRGDGEANGQNLEGYILCLQQ